MNNLKKSQSAPVVKNRFQRSSDKMIRRSRAKLLKWFRKEGRDLPWRRTKDPYSIWISEVMLQQTTAAAVVPYYKKFLKAFPDRQSLAKARREAVYELWAGLGYYKRADCLIKAARETAKRKRFPSSYKQLLKLPGFGPYTARAVSSLAFEEPCGVIDGNVIRFLSRFYNLPVQHWTAEGKARLQSLADQWAAPAEGFSGKEQAGKHATGKARPAPNTFSPSLLNQALMEIGALVCKKSSPACGSCPVQKDCAGFAANAQRALPLQKPKPKKQLLHWKPLLIKQKKKDRFAFIQNRSLPFLKGRLVFPGSLSKISARPPAFHFQHSITHYKIYVSVQSAEKREAAPPSGDFSMRLVPTDKRQAAPLPVKGEQAAPPSGDFSTRLGPGARPVADRLQAAGLPVKQKPEGAGKLIYLDKEKIKRRNPSSLIQKILRFSEKQ